MLYFCWFSSRTANQLKVQGTPERLRMQIARAFAGFRLAEDLTKPIQRGLSIWPKKKKKHCPVFPERTTTSRGLPKFSVKISHRQSPCHYIFQPQFSVQWFIFRKIQQYFEFFDDFILRKFPCHFRILAWMGLVPVANVTLHVIYCGHYHLGRRFSTTKMSLHLEKSTFTK